MNKNNHSRPRRIPLVVRSKSGSALVLVISVILLITMFATVSLFASLANMRMSSRYRDWSEEYFTSDANLENILARTDTLLKQAETYTGDYMKSQYYKFTVSELPNNEEKDSIIPGISMYNLISSYQSNIYDKWNSLGLCDSYAEYYAGIDKNEDGTPSEDYLDEGAYQEEIAKFNQDMYERLYFFFSYNLIDKDNSLNSKDSLYSITHDEKLEEKKIVLTIETPTYEVKKALNFDIKFDYEKDKAMWQLAINSESGPEDNKHTVDAVLSVKKPGAETVISVINNPVYGNPLWGYALAAEGDITFTSDAKVYGDVFAASRKLDDTDTNSIKINGGADVSISGNVYANGDVTALGNGAKLTVNNAKTSDKNVSYSKKQKIYAGSQYRDTDLDNLFMNYDNAELFKPTSEKSAGSIKYTEGSSSLSGAVPLLYQDAIWGNVYCHDFKVDEKASGAIMTIAGNLITSDDIEMDGTQSTITLAGNYVGINSESVDKNANASSSIINNHALDDNGYADSSIYLLGNMIVPGVAYQKYDGTDNNYYPTIESVSSKDYDTFKRYLFDETKIAQQLLAGISDKAAVYDYGSAKYYMKNFYTDEELQTMGKNSSNFTNRLNDFITNMTDKIKSRIFITALNGYSLGIVIPDVDADKDGQSEGGSVVNPLSPNNIANYTLNEDNFRTSSELLKNVQDAKTKYFGYDDSGLKMSQLVASGLTKAVYFFYTKQDGQSVVKTLGTYGDSYVIDISDINVLPVKSGIIYSTGNLTIKGSGTFSGVILSEGNVTVEGNVTIEYSEDAVNSVISNSKSLAARNFFKPGCDYGKEYFSNTYTYYEDYDSTSGIKTETKRYRIESWLEGTK